MSKTETFAQICMCLLPVGFVATVALQNYLEDCGDLKSDYRHWEDKMNTNEGAEGLEAPPNCAIPYEVIVPVLQSPLSVILTLTSCLTTIPFLAVSCINDLLLNLADKAKEKTHAEAVTSRREASSEIKR